jgi:fructokinase
MCPVPSSAVTPEPTKRAIAFGEALIDEFPDRRVVAGAPLHFAARLASFGWHAYLITRVGTDEDGLAVAETLRRHGVDSSLVEVDDTLPTGTTVIEMDGTAHRFTIAEPVAWDAIEGPDPLPGHDILYFGTLALRDVRSRAAWRRIVDRSTAAFNVTDLNLREPFVDAEIVDAVVATADLLKANDTEIDEVARLLGLSSGHPGNLFEAGPEWVCVTHGASGADLWHRDGGRWTADGIDAEVVDTVGAGDAFTAAVVDAIVAGADGQEAVDRANRHAAATVGVRGGLPEPAEGPAPRSRILR